MITNPFARKPKSPLDQAFDVIDNVRADAAETAATIRNAAAQAADALGDPPPVPGGRRLPIIGLLVAAGLAVALVIRARAGRRSTPPAPAPVPPPPSVATAAKATATPATKSGETRPAAEIDAEKSSDPKAETSESEAASETK